MQHRIGRILRGDATTSPLAMPLIRDWARSAGGPATAQAASEMVENTAAMPPNARRMDVSFGSLATTPFVGDDIGETPVAAVYSLRPFRGRRWPEPPQSGRGILSWR
jgi:hypothetical protein